MRSLKLDLNESALGAGMLKLFPDAGTDTLVDVDSPAVEPYKALFLFGVILDRVNVAAV
jgi:hypothetical protein